MNKIWSEELVSISRVLENINFLFTDMENISIGKKGIEIIDSNGEALGMIEWDADNSIYVFVAR